MSITSILYIYIQFGIKLMRLVTDIYSSSLGPRAPSAGPIRPSCDSPSFSPHHLFLVSDQTPTILWSVRPEPGTVQS